MTAALLLARRFWPILAALAVLAALWAYGNSRYRDGVQTERGKWQQAAAKAEAIATETARRQAEAVNLANTEAAAARIALAALSVKTKEVHHAYYRDRPVVQCLDAVRLRAIQEGDAAAEAIAGTPD